MKFNKDLIFDLGLHKGEDTEYYLKRGFKVVAVEADEDLVKYNKIRFTKEVKDKRLIILHGAISDTNESKIIFYKNKKKSVWGTAVKSWADRNLSLGFESSIEYVNVIKLNNLFEQYGIPYY